MSLSTAPSDRAREEAADWFARLKKQDVPAADLEAFRLWRKAPGHKEAYDEVDAFWRRSQALARDPDIQAALTGALGRAAPPPRRAGARPVIGLGLALALVLAVGGASYLALGPKSYDTEVGERRTVRLADGSTLTLDTDSQVSVRLSRGRRAVELRRGQALFDVAHDAQRPFVVTAGAAAVTALGTRFDVRRAEAGAVITLVTGAVEVREQGGGGRVWRLAPGQRLATQSPSARPAPVDVASATSWSAGRLVFKDIPLREAVAEFNRYEREKIILDPGPWAEDRVTGAFDVGDAKTFVGSVAQLHDLQVLRPEGGGVRLTRASHDGAP